MTSSVIDILKQVICVSAVTFFITLAVSWILVGMAVLILDRDYKR